MAKYIMSNRTAMQQINKVIGHPRPISGQYNRTDDVRLLSYRTSSGNVSGNALSEEGRGANTTWFLRKKIYIDSRFIDKNNMAKYMLSIKVIAKRLLELQVEEDNEKYNERDELIIPYCVVAKVYDLVDRENLVFNVNFVVAD
jgi:hypothetical protein